MGALEVASAIVRSNAWSFLVVEGNERQFQGNAGYEDVVEESYSYDSTVGNHRRVSVGDVVIVRTSREALGVGYIEELEVIPNQKKTRRRCPQCGSTGFKERVSQQPRYRCSPCTTVFDHPRVEVINVTSYRAHYGRTWQPLEGCLDRTELAELSLSKSDQQSIKAMDTAKTLAAVASRGIRLPHRSRTADTQGHRSFELPGGRRRTTAAARRGQDAFRKALVRQYGLVCAVTGPAPAEVLEAAHLRPFATTERHCVGEGLLLRSDVHRLFDSGLLAISHRLTVCVAPSIAGHDTYRVLDGSSLHLPEATPLNRAVLAEHHAATTATW